MFLITTLGLMALSLALLAAWFYVLPTASERRVQELTGEAQEHQWKETVLKAVGPLARLSTPEGTWDRSPLRIRFLNAGIRHEDARLFYYAAKTLLPLSLAGTAFIALQMLGNSDVVVLMLQAMLAATLGYYLPNVILWMMRRERQREIFETFPDAADMLLVCVEAGLGLDAGMTRVAEEMRRRSHALSDELHLTNLELRAGGTRESSLRNLALRTGVEEIGTFATMLTQADKFGTSIGDSLRVFSDELRSKRQLRAEEMAAKVPTKMLFPLVLFIFPSIIMVILGPAAIQIVRTLMPLFNN